MSKKKDGGKITLGMLKGKSVTTSVPSIAIKFHANAEHLEELYASDEETVDKSDKISSISTVLNSGEPENSPLKYLPKLIKRSTSIDVSSAPLDSSPPSDPWKFFSDIRGKITKSVEDKFTEIKQRNQEENSPSKSKLIKDSKENSSLSDSEDLSESSISRTCGIVSTTEGVEMSSEDDTPSLDKDKWDKSKEEKIATEEVKPDNVPDNVPTEKIGLRHRFRLLKNKKLPPKNGTTTTSALSKLYNISTENVEQALPENNDDVENAVDALAEEDASKVVISKLSDSYDNIELDSDRVLNITTVEGKDIKAVTFEARGVTVFAPTGYVDMRPRTESALNFTRLLYILSGLFVYLLILKISSFIAGLLTGIAFFAAYVYLTTKAKSSKKSTPALSEEEVSEDRRSSKILEVPAADEFMPIVKYEGWMNEFPEEYDPTTYHISMTQSVFLRLQGNLLRVSHTRAKVAKRAMWNEPNIKPQLVHHRVYNLLGAKICLLPEGLNKKRHWSKKYPICITLPKDQMNFDKIILEKFKEEDKEDQVASNENPDKKNKDKTKKTVTITQQFSKLTEEDEYEDVEPSTSRPSTPSFQTDISESQQSHGISDETKDSEKETEQQDDDSLDEWTTYSPDGSPTETKIFLFGRTDREKEDWYRKFTAATHKGANNTFRSASVEVSQSISSMLLRNVVEEDTFFKYMMLFNQVRSPAVRPTVKPKPTSKTKLHHNSKKNSLKDRDLSSQSLATEPVLQNDVLWFNALVGRILYDCMRDPTFTQRVKERLQRKLAAIRLPYFIAQLTLTELNLGTMPPFIKNVYRPMLDEKGLWIDLDITYEGLVVCTLQTQLNLMKLKQPQKEREKIREHKSAMFNSDVDDSAESSSDEDDSHQPVLDHAGFPITQGGHSNTSKKFIKMVDKIADSRFFQAATDMRYIKRAMEGVSNTDLRLTVSLQALTGTLVLNIPLPPSDRIWLGFRPVPQLNLTAKPIVGERNITFLRITSWIEQQLVKEFQKVFVIPNMEDVMIPVMCPDLPR